MIHDEESVESVAVVAIMSQVDQVDWMVERGEKTWNVTNKNHQNKTDDATPT
jgi:hypothetical protein